MREPLESSVPDHEHGTAALRLWLTSGIHTLRVDRRRRAGTHSQVRQLLVAEAIKDGGWSETVSALRRHTLHAALAQLSAVERSLISLAYLEGQTNRQIATAFGVSVTTVRRRLWKALARLEAYVASSGAWLASIVLLGFAFFVQWTRAGRLMQSVRASGWLEPAATVATGVVAVSVIGIVVSGVETPAVAHRVPPVKAALPAAVASGLGPSLLRTLDIPKTAVNAAEVTAAPASDSTTTKAPSHTHGKHRSLGHSKPKL